ncbi:MAG TPA: thiazole synthase [Mycobacteriales bacterium]|nr:thiazole synthase [Mycobacteriales bacterium]
MRPHNTSDGRTSGGRVVDRGHSGPLSGRPLADPLAGRHIADPLVVAGRQLRSRLLVGTGKFAAHEIMRAAVLASGTEIVTVALRRVDLDRAGDGDILDFVPPGIQLLPNTSGAVDADEAVRLARLGRAGTGTDWVKLEVTPDPRTLAPDPVDTLRAAELLVAEGFIVLPYCPADPVLCKRLEEAGCATVMPLGAWIGSNRGLRTRDAIEVIVAQAGVPVVVDAGLGVPSDAAEAMEVGADAVLVNTAIAVARDPVAMARAFALATVAGRLGYLAGRGAVGVATTAEASSPLTGFLTHPVGTPTAAASAGATRPAGSDRPAAAGAGAPGGRR